MMQGKQQSNGEMSHIDPSMYNHLSSVKQLYQLHKSKQNFLFFFYEICRICEASVVDMIDL